ncbi:sodium:proton antiporter [bacterium]|nr:sodium:proton antiporter [bacterium]
MDHNYLLLVLAGIVFFYGLFSGFLGKKNISGPMLIIAFALLFGPSGLNLISFEIEIETVEYIAELALVLVLFTGASTVKLSELKKAWQIPVRLLSVGLLLTIFLGIAVGYYLFPHTNFYALVLLALILTPTDAALGKAVVQNRDVPESLRESINVESGLNDGIIFPMILATTAVMLHSSAESEIGWGIFIVKQIVFGFVGGGIVGFLGGKFAVMASKRDWMEVAYQRLLSFALAIISYYAAEAMGGNGFIAAFVAGMFITLTTKSLQHKLQEFGDAESELLLAVVFLFVGFITVPALDSYWTWRTVVYALLSLTVIRMVPVTLSLLGLHLSWKEILFLGWFGPRGIASTLYAIIVFAKLNDPAMNPIFSVVLLTVLLSIFLHGVSALPAIKYLNKR